MKSIILFGIAFGIAMAVIWSIVFVNILGTLGIGVGIGLGVSFASCGFIFGYAISSEPVDAMMKNSSSFSIVGAKRARPSTMSTPSSPQRVRISSLTCPVIPGCFAPCPEGVCE